MFECDLKGTVCYLLPSPAKIGATVEEFDPAFRELVQTTNTASSQDAENEGDSVDGNESGAEDEGGVAVEAEDSLPGGSVIDEIDTAEVWITSIYEEHADSEIVSSKRVLAVASVDVRAHKVQCATFSANEGGDAVEQDISSYLDLLKVRRCRNLLISELASLLYYYITNYSSRRRSCTATTCPLAWCDFSPDC